MLIPRSITRRSFPIAAAAAVLSVALVVYLVAAREVEGGVTEETPVDLPVLSVFQRAPQTTDALPSRIQARYGRVIPQIEASEVRLAFQSEKHSVFLVRPADPAAFDGNDVCIITPDGLACGQLANIAEHGAMVMWGSSSAAPGYVVIGLIPDGVRSVRVGNTTASLGENVFVAEVATVDAEAVVTTETGETRSIALVPDAPPPDSQEPDDDGGKQLRP